VSRCPARRAASFFTQGVKLSSHDLTAPFPRFLLAAVVALLYQSDGSYVSVCLPFFGAAFLSGFFPPLSMKPLYLHPHCFRTGDSGRMSCSLCPSLVPFFIVRRCNSSIFPRRPQPRFRTGASVSSCPFPFLASLNPMPRNDKL